LQPHLFCDLTGLAAAALLAETLLEALAIKTHLLAIHDFPGLKRKLCCKTHSEQEKFSFLPRLQIYSETGK
jgi:hypothetical protein